MTDNDFYKKIKDNWQDILLVLKDLYELPEVSYKTWLLPLRPDSFRDGALSVVYPGDRLGLGYIERKYKYCLIKSIETVCAEKCEVTFICEGDDIPAPGKNSVSSYITVNGNRLNPVYTFDNFVVGNSNKFAQAVSLAVAESPGELYNPLYIHGGVGLGKTHLMHAIALFILQNDPTARVLYTTCESFNNDLLDAIRNKNNYSFREKYRNADILLIDDIQFLSRGGEYIQEEIFNTFNHLYELKKQIVFASDRPPKEIDNIDDRIISRFLQGITVEILPPDYETRIAILRKKEELENYNVDAEVINYIASKVKSNIRELEGALKKVILYAKVNNREINLALAEETLKDHLSSYTEQEITSVRIREVVAEHFGLKVTDLASEKRNKDIAFPRHVAMYLCCELTNDSLKTIARVLGKKDHSTIIHGRDKIIKDMKTDDELRGKIEILKKKLSPSG